MCNSPRRGRGIRERKENIEGDKASSRMISDGYYTSKKSDEICQHICDEVCSFLSFSIAIYALTFAFVGMKSSNLMFVFEFLFDGLVFLQMLGVCNANSFIV